MPTKSAIIATPAEWGKDCAALCAVHGVDARVVDDGIDALLAALEHVPQIIVYDAEPPGVDHVSLCRKLKRQAQLTHVEMLLLSAEAISEYTSLNIHCAPTVQELLDTLSPMLTGIGGVMPSSTASTATSGPQPTMQASRRSRPTILLVDDDRDLLRGLKVRLSAYDIDVATETGGRDALYTALSIKPSVIVTDYSMPQGNGEYFLLRLKDEPALRNVPIIVITGWTFDESPDAALQREMLGRCGASAYLRKPVDFPVLLAELERYVPMRTRAKATA